MAIPGRTNYVQGALAILAQATECLREEHALSCFTKVLLGLMAVFHSYRTAV